MKKIISLIICITIIGCVTPNPLLFNASSEKFKNRYKEFINSGETEIASWYNYVKTKSNDNSYILRTFFPETKQITSEVKFKDKSTRIANGPAKYWHENGNLKSEGTYVNSLSTDLWKFYHRKSGHISSKGNFDSNKKQGLWEIYDSKGRLQEILNYNNDIREGKFTQYDSLKIVTNEGVYKSDTIFKQTKIDTTNYTLEIGKDEQMPFLSQCKEIKNKELRNKCSQKAMLEYIYSSLKYPKKSRNLGLEGMTVTQFVIDVDGSVSDIDVVIGLCQEFKDLNIEILSNMPKWEPGIQRGEKVKVLYTLPIKYKLE